MYIYVYIDIEIYKYNVYIRVYKTKQIKIGTIEADL